MGFATSLAGNTFQIDKKIKRLKAPLLIIHGTEDPIIPIDLGRAVFDAALSPKSFHEIKGAGHNDLSDRFAEKYWPKISDFIKRESEIGEIR